MSAIEWTDETWNPTVGCSRVSPGCDNCYAEKVAARNLTAAHRGLTEGGKWTGEVRCLPDRLETPLRWRKPRRVFVDSMSDLFHPDVPVEFIAQVFAVMALTPEHTYQVLTKRPKRMAHLVDGQVIEDPEVALEKHVLAAIDEHVADDPSLHHRAYQDPGNYYKARWPLPNVWLGVSVENQTYADLRIPHLLATPAEVRFLSCEPLLGPVDLAPFTDPHRGSALRTLADRIQWVIVGGESGPGARPMHPQWARSLRDQCVAASVPYFFKQWGEWAHAWWANDEPTPNGYAGGTCRLDGPGLQPVMRRVGKKNAGRELDGRTWDETP